MNRWKKISKLKKRTESSSKKTKIRLMLEVKKNEKEKKITQFCHTMSSKEERKSLCVE
jgi:hypothetical protein